MIRLRSGTERLIGGVRENFRRLKNTASVEFGDRELAKQANQGPGGANRVVFVPFDPKSGAAGSTKEPRKPGRFDIMSEDDPTRRLGSTRPLADWERLFIVSVWAVDTDRPEDEMAQQVAAELLLEDTVNAVIWTGLANVAFEGPVTCVTQGERRFGRELRAQFRFTHPLFERPAEAAYPSPEITKTDDA